MASSVNILTTKYGKKRRFIGPEI